ncbi:unnamed protein product, partial [marine sediment metagenome]
GVDIPLEAIGAPQCGHAAACVDTSCPQSSQLIRDI